MVERISYLAHSSMADAVSSPLLRQLSDRLNKFLVSNNTSGNGEILSAIRTTISKIETLVRNKEKRTNINSNSNESSLHFRWLTEVKEFAHEIDDFFDQYEVITVRRSSLCSSCFSSSKLRNEMKKIMERLNQLFIIGFRFSVTNEGLIDDNDEEKLKIRDYNNLPSHLKQCFAYCSIFPKNYVINKEKLIRMWIAEGFINVNDDGGDSYTLEEDIGNGYYVELVGRSFFQEVTRREDGERVDFVVHGLVYELAQSVSRIECSIVENGVSMNLSPKVRRYSLLSAGSGPLVIPESLFEATKLRTLLLLLGRMDDMSVVFERFSCLGVLDLSRSSIRKVPVSIGKLKHLKYLDLSCTNIEYLPESIGNLKMLQTLDLFGCYNLRKLSRSICRLTSLRYLDIRSCCSLTQMPVGVGKLGHLQKLPAFILGKNDNCAKISELNGLNLRGRLEIKNLEYVRCLKDAEDAKLHEKQSLHYLGLFWGHDVNMRDGVSTEVFESLRPPRELKVLGIVGYTGSTLPSWIMNESLLSLVKLSLINCSCLHLPSLGHLPYLEDLYIKGLPEVQIIDDEFYGDGAIRGFPSLKLLELYNLTNLLEWRTGRGTDSFPISGEPSNYSTSIAFPCLETLIVKGCNMLSHIPLIPNLKNLALWNSNPTLLRSLIHLKTLSSLVINGFREPNCYVEFIWFIKNLTLYDCDDLISQLDDGMRGLKSLKKLSVLYCDKLTSLPEGLRHLTSLQKLDIVDCKKLATIPDIMTYVWSLEELVIEDCPLLSSLPDSMCNLTSLQKLVIRKCPQLEKRLKRGTGEDWFKIAHVPSIEIERE